MAHKINTLHVGYVFSALCMILCVHCSTPYAAADVLVGAISDRHRGAVLSCTRAEATSSEFEISIIRARDGVLSKRYYVHSHRRLIRWPVRKLPRARHGYLMSVSSSTPLKHCALRVRTDSSIRRILFGTAEESAANFTDGCHVADLNGDGVVTGQDLSVFISQFGRKHSIADLNGDGLVNGIDLSLLLSCFSENSSSNSSSSSSSAASSSSTSAQPFSLIPGTGFAGPTLEPAANCNSGFGCAARPAARWDVVPFQTFSGMFDIGVVAFHVNGIERVSFSANGGPWSDVREMTLNPATGVVEFVVRLDASRFSDGRVEIRAIAFPHVGTPRVLDPLLLSANALSSLPTIERFVAPAPLGNDNTGIGTRERPYASIFKAARAIQDARGDGRADGGIVSLLPGSYSFGAEPGQAFPWYYEFATHDRWLVIRPAAGVSRAQVEINRADGSGFKSKLVKVENVTVRSNGGAVLTDGGAISAALWIDGARLIGPGREVDMNWVGYAWFGGKYLTNTHISDSRGGIEGARLQRNVLVERIGSDAFSNSLAVINSEARDIRAPSSNFHPDVYQFYQTAPNVVLYGVKALQEIDSQGFFIKDVDIRDVAIIDCDLDVCADDGATCQAGAVFAVDTNANGAGVTINHLYVRSSNFIGPNRFAPIQTTHSVMENVLFSPIPQWSVLGLIMRE